MELTLRINRFRKERKEKLKKKERKKKQKKRNPLETVHIVPLMWSHLDGDEYLILVLSLFQITAAVAIKREKDFSMENKFYGKPGLDARKETEKNCKNKCWQT